MALNGLQALAAASVLLLLATALRRRLRLLDRLNLPTPVIAGLLAALAGLFFTAADAPLTIDTAPQKPLMTAFFVSIGFAASFRALSAGGPGIILLLGLSAVLAALQGLAGAGMAAAFGLPPLLGVLAGTVTLSGGPATGLAFAAQFEAAGVSGAATIAAAMAMAGILAASLVAAPLATLRIRAHRSAGAMAGGAALQLSAIPAADAPARDPMTVAAIALAAMLTAMALGEIVSEAIRAQGVTLPGYIGAMLVASVLRNAEDLSGRRFLPMSAISLIGAIALSLFLVLAIMNLDLRVLAGLAIPLLAMLGMQIVLTAAFALGPVWWVMGRNHEGAVMAGGVMGYMLGTTANAVAAIYALVEKHGPAPNALLAVPLVGAFFLDFANALIIVGFLNLFG